MDTQLMKIFKWVANFIGTKIQFVDTIDGVEQDIKK